MKPAFTEEELIAIDSLRSHWNNRPESPTTEFIIMLSPSMFDLTKRAAEFGLSGFEMKEESPYFMDCKCVDASIK